MLNTSPTGNRPLLQATGLRKLYRSGGFLLKKGLHTAPALDGVSLDIMPGEIVGLVGESGSGKTTFGKAVIRLIKVDSGSIVFDGIDLLSLKNSELRPLRRRFQMLFQNPSSTLHPNMTVGALLEESLKLHRKLGKTEAKDAAAALLRKVSLEDRLHAYPAELSGGQKRRVGIARILAATPQLVVADEPTSGLDALLRAEIVDLLLAVRDEGVAYLIISHDLNVVQRACDRVAVMYRGKIVEQLPKDAITRDGHHPYTEALFKAAARLRGDLRAVQPSRVAATDRAEEITGSGCAYRSRCSLAAATPSLGEGICRQATPALEQVADNRWIACHGFPKR